MRANEFVAEKWSKTYKRSIDCDHPKGFSQRAHCAGRKKVKEEDVEEQLYFKGSPCTQDCSGHRAGYEWSTRKSGQIANSWSTSFNNGASLHRAGK